MVERCIQGNRRRAARRCAGGRRRAGPVRVWLAALLAGLVCAAAGATVRDLRIDDPRDFGWFIGDLITRSITVEVSPGFDLDRGALPAPDEINHWLSLVAVDVASEGQVHRIELVYRITNRPEGDGTRVIPGFNLYTSAAARRVPTNVPEWRFSQLPVVPPAVTALITAGDVRPDRPPTPAPWSGHFVRTAMLSLAVLVLALYLFYCHFGAAWLSRWRRPFTAALRQMRRELGSGWSAEQEQLGLKRFHEAVNEAAGRVVMAGDVDAWLRECPLYAAEREGIHELFDRSRRLFFDAGAGGGRPVSRERLMTLCRRLSVLELSTP